MKYRSILLLFCAPFLFAGSLPSLKYRALDNSGDPISGAKLYFYEAGTTTPTATYPTEDDVAAETNANANPVVADSNGWFGEVFLQTDQEYKVVMKNSDDSTTYFTVDDIYATELVSSLLSTRVKQIASNPLDYRSAVGDGVADEYLAVQDAIDNATGTVDLLGKTFRCDTAITLSDGITLKNGTLDFTQSTDSRFVTARGTQDSNSVALTSDGSAGDVDVVVDATDQAAASLAAGDWVIIYSDGVYISGGSPTQEILRIDSISSNTITMVSPLQQTFTTANNAAMKELNTKSNITIDNVSFLSTNSSGTTLILSFLYGENINVINSRFNGARLEAIEVDDSAYVTIKDTIFEDASTTAGSGIDLEGASRNVVIEDCTFEAGAYGIEIPAGLPVKDINIESNNFNGTDEPIYIQGYAENVSIIGNTFVDDDGTNAQISGLTTGAVISNFEISHNKFFNGTAAIKLGSWHQGVSGKVKIAHNMIVGAGGINLTEDANNAITAQTIHVSDNQISSGSVTVVAGAGSGAYNEVNVTNNELKSGSVTVTDPSTSARVYGNYLVSGTIDIADVATSTADVVSVTVSNNSLTSGAVTVDVSNGAGSFERVLVSGNTINEGEIVASANSGTADMVDLNISNNIVNSDSATPLVDIDSVNMATVSGNQLTGASATYGIEITDIDNALISGNTIYNADINLDDGSTNVASESIRVVNNHLLDGQISLVGTTSTSTYDRVIISGNTLEDGEIIVTESATTTISNVTISDNMIDTVAAKIIDVTDAGRVIVSDNTIHGDGTNTTDGIELTDTDTSVVVTGNSISGFDLYYRPAVEIETSDNATTLESIIISDNHAGEGCIDVFSNTASAQYNEVKIHQNSLDSGTIDVDAGAGTIKRVSISGNNIYCAAASSILIETDDIEFLSATDNVLTGDGTNTLTGVSFDATAGDATVAIISDNMITGVITDGVYIYEVDSITVSGNTIEGDDTIKGIDVDLNAGGTAAGEAVINGNRILGCGIIGIDVEDMKNIVINSNWVETNTAGATGCIDVLEFIYGTISGNTLYCAGGGIELETNTNYVSLNISSNQIYSDGADGIFINQADGSVGTQSTVISGNSVYASGAYSSLDITGDLKNIAITGNVFDKDELTVDNIQLNGADDAPAIQNVSISGNSIMDGAYGVGEPWDDNNTQICICGNVIEDNASGDTEGTIDCDAGGDANNL